MVRLNLLINLFLFFQFGDFGGNLILLLDDIVVKLEELVVLCFLESGRLVSDGTILCVIKWYGGGRKNKAALVGLLRSVLLGFSIDEKSLLVLP